MNLENSESWRGKKDEVATSIARVMEFSCCCGIALRYVGRASEF